MEDIEIREARTDWEYTPVLINAVSKNYDCFACGYKILAGSQAVKDGGAFRHYPRCPSNRRENKQLVGNKQIRLE